MEWISFSQKQNIISISRSVKLNLLKLICIFIGFLKSTNKYFYCCTSKLHSKLLLHNTQQLKCFQMLSAHHQVTFNVYSMEILIHVNMFYFQMMLWIVHNYICLSCFMGYIQDYVFFKQSSRFLSKH